MTIDLVAGLLLAFIGTCGVSLLFAGLKLLFGDSEQYKRNRVRTSSFRRAITGCLPTMHEGGRDYRVSAGIAVNTKTGKWVEQGRLSDEAVQATARPL